jgi:hypothetical protein
MSAEHLTDDSSLEQRRSPRVDLFREITCELGDVVARSQVADISVGGMFIDMPRPPFPPGSLVTARFALRTDEPGMVTAAEVSYVQQWIGMGIRFVDLEDADRERIFAFVEEAARRKSMGAPPVRKSARVSVQVPVRVRAMRADGPGFDERTRIITLSKHGACLVSGYHPDVGVKLLLETANGREFKSNVVWVGSAATRSEGQVGVQCRGLAQSLGFQFP